jgi:uncharacterized protein YceH (UPF0502 family)
VDLDAAQVRVLGCLVEKQSTTPDAYPLTLNSLRLACNQSTNRDPVVDYDEPTVREAAQRLGQRGLARLASYHGSRAHKYRHLVDEELGLPGDERALLCVLMLRGPQTSGELKQRAERLHSFADLAAVEAALDRLTERDLGRWLERRPGQKEARYTHLMDEDADGAAEASAPEPIQASAPSPAPAPTPQPQPDGLADEVAVLRRELDSLRADLDALREEMSQLTS